MIFTALENSTIRIKLTATVQVDPNWFIVTVNDEDRPLYTWDGGTIGTTQRTVPAGTYEYPAISLSAGDILWIENYLFEGSTGFSDVDTTYQFVMTGRIKGSGKWRELMSRRGTSVSPVPSYKFRSIFKGCTALVEMEDLPPLSWGNYTLYEAFSGCTGLTTLPGILEGASIQGHTCESMFKNCTGATSAGDIGALLYGTYCCAHMYEGCTSLTDVPLFHHYGTQQYSLYQAFKGCTSLQRAAVWCDTLADNSLYQMFQGCSSLNYVNVQFSSWNGNATYQWLDGVAQTGTFVGFSSLDTTKSSSTIPTGWTFKGHGDYLTFSMDPQYPDAAMEFSLTKIGNPWSASFEYRYKVSGQVTWTNWETLKLGAVYPHYDQDYYQDAPPLPNYTQVQVRRAPQAEPCKLGSSSYDCYTFTVQGRTAQADQAARDNVYCSGELDSLINWDPITPYCFTRVFLGTQIRTVPDMPSKDMQESCYERLYYGCIRLTSGGTIPKVTMAPNCFRNMYSGCISLRRIRVEFTSWIADGYVVPEFMPTTEWLDRVYEKGIMCKPPELAENCGVDGDPWCDVSSSEDSSSSSLDCSDSSEDPYFGIDIQHPPAPDKIITDGGILTIGYIDSDLIGPEVKALHKLSQETLSGIIHTALSRGTLIRVPSIVIKHVYNHYDDNPFYCTKLLNYMEWSNTFVSTRVKAGCWVIAGTDAVQVTDAPSVYPAFKEVSDDPWSYYITEGGYAGSIVPQFGYASYSVDQYLDAHCYSAIASGNKSFYVQNDVICGYITAYKSFVSGVAEFIHGVKGSGTSEYNICENWYKCGGFSPTLECPNILNNGEAPLEDIIQHCGKYWGGIISTFVAGFFSYATTVWGTLDRLDPDYSDPTGFNKTICTPHCFPEDITEDDPCLIPPDCTVYKLVIVTGDKDELDQALCEAVREMYCEYDPGSEYCQVECRINN